MPSAQSGLPPAAARAHRDPQQRFGQPGAARAIIFFAEASVARRTRAPRRGPPDRAHEECHCNRWISPAVPFVPVAPRPPGGIMGGAKARVGRDSPAPRTLLIGRTMRDLGPTRGYPHCCTDPRTNMGFP